MALNWNIFGCAGFIPVEERSPAGDVLALPNGMPIPWPITERLIFASMVIGWGWELKAKDVPEVLARLERIGMVQDGCGTPRPWWDDLPNGLTPAAVLLAHVGLHTNTVPEGPSWWTRIARTERDNLRRIARETAAAYAEANEPAAAL